MLAFLNIFLNMHTGASYVGTVRWAVKLRGLSREWDTEQIALAIKGGKKLTLRMLGAKLDLRKVLNSKLVHQVVALSDQMCTDQSSVLYLLSWYYLMRVVSEAIPLEPRRHSAVWMKEEGQLTIRWTRRKHRPRGAVMKRPCMCEEVGPQFCVVCRTKPYLVHGQKGARLFDDSSYTHIQRLRRYLALLAVEDATSYTWKAFRSGRATEMAAMGFTLGQVLAAGDWHSVAMLKCIRETEADTLECVRQAAENSDDEEE